MKKRTFRNVPVFREMHKVLCRKNNLFLTLFFNGIVLSLFFLLSHALFPSSSRAAVVHAEDLDPHYSFTVPKGLEKRVKFWVDVYATYGRNQHMLHDQETMDVYKVVDFREPRFKGYTKRKRDRYLKRLRRSLQNQFRRVAFKVKHHKKLTPSEAKIAKLVGKGSYAKRIRNIRTQQGIRERFAEGIIRSGRVMYKIDEILENYGLPKQLRYLPHVESSFNYKAYSSAGAAGIWQFIRSAGKLYLTVNSVVDERKDPFTESYAAARHLKQNYKELKSWPLAITAYNHGLGGMMRAKKRLHTDNIAVIIKKYRSRTFGFASKNFYAEFLAASHVAKNYRKYFGDLPIENPRLYREIHLTSYHRFSDLAKRLNISEETLAEYNPALMRRALLGKKYVPAGYDLKVPYTSHKEYQAKYAQIPRSERFSKQIWDRWYRVKRGDTLSHIARRHRVSVRALKEANNLRSSRIYYRQRLEIPRSSYRSHHSRFASAKKGKKKTSYRRKNIATKTHRQRLREVSVVETTAQSRRSAEKGYHIVRVRFDETVSHFADWAGVSARKIRKLNHLSRRRHLHLGMKLKVPTKNASPTLFHARRNQHHQKVEDAYFKKYNVESVRYVKLVTGDTIWEMCDKHNIPLWLFRKYNAELDINSLKLGTTIALPVIRKVSVARAN